MELNLTVKENNSPVLTSIKYTKKLDFIDFDQPEKIEFDSICTKEYNVEKWKKLL